jgi:hypothetical protein
MHFPTPLYENKVQSYDSLLSNTTQSHDFVFFSLSKISKTPRYATLRRSNENFFFQLCAMQNATKLTLRYATQKVVAQPIFANISANSKRKSRA